MQNKFILLVIIMFLISSCSGFKLKRSEKSDEFLIEKKNPLVMPPDIDELPKPEENLGEEPAEDFKKILNIDNIENNDESSNTNSSLKESIIKKIEE